MAHCTIINLTYPVLSFHDFMQNSKQIENLPLFKTHWGNLASCVQCKIENYLSKWIDIVHYKLPIVIFWTKPYEILLFMVWKVSVSRWNHSSPEPEQYCHRTDWLVLPGMPLVSLPGEATLLLLLSFQISYLPLRVQNHSFHRTKTFRVVFPFTIFSSKWSWMQR